ncbi:hypothetical protein EZV62_024642 [Acer yangbiense]|uniref:F-box domain-containing protein n=1 Tax=Acer yangbiense TaxID=1000413 RepID=A0A5C7GW88_9ROSI|nr:hypothetical protein EZV62_024642 [Acer yangbiense]
MSSQVAYSANKRIKIRIKWRKQESFSSLDLRRWEDLSPDILEKIFDGVPISDLSQNVSAVCRSWQLSCWHFLCWAKDELDLSVTNATLEIVKSTGVKPLNEIGDVACSTKKYAQALVDIKLMELLKSIMEDNDVHGINLTHWRLSIRKVSIPENIKISDKHLIYIAERTIGLEELDLLGSSRVTGAGFTKAICNWKNVKSIRLGKVRPEYYSQIIQEIRKNCCMLKVLYLNKRNFRYNGENGMAIAQNLVQARSLGVPMHLFPEKEKIKFKNWAKRCFTLPITVKR